MQFVNFLETAILLIGLNFSAGPANILLASSVSNQGYRKTLPVLTGLWIPMAIYTFISGFALNSFMSEYFGFVNLLSILGVVYITYLGIKLSKTKTTLKNSTDKHSNKIAFRDGFLISLLNGKLIVALSLIYSVGLTSGSNYISVVIVALMFILIGLMASATWMTMGGILKKILTDRYQEMLNKVYGILLLVLSSWILLQTLIPLVESGTIWPETSGTI